MSLFLWFLVGTLVWPACYVWLVRYIYSLETMYEVSDAKALLIAIAALPFAIPICIGMFTFGTIFKALVWATNRG